MRSATTLVPSHRFRSPGKTTSASAAIGTGHLDGWDCDDDPVTKVVDTLESIARRADGGSVVVPHALDTCPASRGPSNGRKADAERGNPACYYPSLLLPDRPLPGLAPVLVDVIFETIERIRDQDDIVLLMEQHALAAFEIADYLYVPEFGKLNMLGDAPKLLDESFVTAANLEGHW